MTWEQLYKKMSREEKNEVKAFAAKIQEEVKGRNTLESIYTEYKINHLLPYCKGASKIHKNVFVLRPCKNDYYLHWEIVQLQEFQPLCLNFLTLDAALTFLEENKALVTSFYKYYGAISVTFKRDGKDEKKFI